MKKIAAVLALLCAPVLVYFGVFLYFEPYDYFGLKGGAVVGNPIPEQYAMDPDYMNKIIDQAVAQANAEHIHGKAITPFLLAHIKDMTGGSSFAANLELAYNNARACSKIACAYAKL